MSTGSLVEERLAAALEARAGLVRPEHLTPSPAPSAATTSTASQAGDARLLRALPTPGDPAGDLADDPAVGTGPVTSVATRRRRWAAYAAVAAAAVTALVVPVWLADGPQERRPAPADLPAPEGWVGGTGRTGPGADLPGSRVSTDLDGDGAPDTLWLRSAFPDRPAAPVRLEALLSSAPDEVTWTVLRERGGSAQLEGAYGVGGLDLRLDAEPGSEVLVLFQPEGADDFALAVVDLVGGRLVEADVDPGATGAPFAMGVEADERRTHFGVLDDATLVTARTREPAVEEVRYRRSEAWTWALRAPSAPGERPVLVPTPRDDVCRDEYGYGFGDCRPGSARPADGGPPVGEGGNPSDVVPDFAPEVTRRLGPGEQLRFTSVAGAGTARLTGPQEEPRLEVDLAGTAYAASLPAGAPASLVAGTVASEAGPGFLVVRGDDAGGTGGTGGIGDTEGAEGGQGAAWTLWQVRDGALVEVRVLAEEVPLDGATDEGLPVSAHLSARGLLSTRLVDPAGDPEVAQVWTWTLDEGPALLSRQVGCFRFPADGAAATFASSC